MKAKEQDIEYFRAFPSELESLKSKAEGWDKVVSYITSLVGNEKWLLEGSTGAKSACLAISKLIKKDNQ